MLQRFLHPLGVFVLVGWAGGGCSIPRNDLDPVMDAMAAAAPSPSPVADAAPPTPPLAGSDAAVAVGPADAAHVIEASDGAAAVTMDARTKQSGEIALFPIPTPNGGAAGLAAGRNGDFWFTEYLGNKLGHITSTGEISEIALEKPKAFPHPIAVAADGTVWFSATGYGGGLLHRTPGGDLVESPQLAPGPWMALVVEASGVVWGTNVFNKSGQGQIWRMGVDGGVKYFAIPPDPTRPGSQAAPGGLTIDREGNLWCAGGVTDIVRLTPASGAIRHFTTADPEDLFNGVAATPDGSIWFTRRLTKKVGRISPSGQISSYDVDEGAPWEIIVAPDGNLWVSSYRLDTITRLEPTGATRQYHLPFAVGATAAGPDGEIWFSGGNSIGRLTP